MALIGSFSKQPSEALPVDISYADVIAGRTVSAATHVVTSAPAGTTESETMAYDTGTETLQLYIGSGLTGQTYRWTIVATFTIGGKDTIVEDEFDVVVLAV